MSAKNAIRLSFLIISVLGCWFIFRHWSLNEGRPGEGLLRCLIFVALMDGLHLVGYRAYQQQQEEALEHGKLGGMGLATQLAPGYGPAVRLALLQQIPVLILSAMLLDGGRVLRIWCIVMLAHWLSVLLVAWRRPSKPTPTDLALIRYGFWLIPVIIGVIAPVV